jgi:hypothetical protein
MTARPPFTDEMERLIRAVHAEFVTNSRTGYFGIEFHYKEGNSLIGKIRGPEFVFTLASTAVA